MLKENFINDFREFSGCILKMKASQTRDYLQIKFILRLFRIISFDFKNLNLIVGTWVKSWVIPSAKMEERSETLPGKFNFLQSNGVHGMNANFYSEWSEEENLEY